MSDESSVLEKHFLKLQKPACPECNGTGKEEVINGLDILTSLCDTCGGYGYLLAKGDYITPEKFQTILESEKKPMYRIIYKLIWHLGLKNGEILKIRPCDIDAVAPERFDMDTGTHTLRVFRKKHSRALPLPKWLMNEILEFVKEENTSSDEIIFKRDRTTLYDRLASYGYTVGKRKKIGPDAVRRGFGICYLAEGGHINELQKIYGHSTGK